MADPEPTKPPRWTVETGRPPVLRRAKEDRCLKKTAKVRWKSYLYIHASVIRFIFSDSFCFTAPPNTNGHIFRSLDINYVPQMMKAPDSGDPLLLPPEVDDCESSFKRLNNY